MKPSIYVLDANVFIEASRRYYAFDLHTPFWDILEKHAKNGAIESIDRVKGELEKETDDLASWANSGFDHAFQSTDVEDVIDAYRKVIAWVHNQAQFMDAAKAEFAGEPDGWLIAYAMAKGRIVVTHEVLAPDARKRVPIPNVCKPFGVRSIDTFTMLRELGARFT
jgi:hypothetical protein